jgi:magnesium-transporting ATPase (P-type)
MEIEGFCQCDPPNSDLHKLDGTISVKYNINNFVYKSKFPISERQMLLKGSVLKNTNWIAGFVLYTGMNNKIILNSKRPRTKISLIENKMNKYLIGIFFLLIILCIICSILHAKKYNENKGYYEIFIILARSNKLESFITFFTYFLLLNTLIPISLIITIEIVKIIQGFFISWDAEMYSLIRHKFAKAKTVSINEELGNVNYIFSDKTGTLTSNKMIFKYCIIQGKCYEYDRNSYKRALDVLKDSEKHVINNETLKSKKKFPIIKFPRNYFSDILRKEPKRNLSNGTSKTQYIKNKNEDKEINIINEFWTAISIAHECVCTKIGEYSGVSPDDVELVKTAHEQGYTFMQSSNKLREIRIGDLIQTFDVLNVLNFSSERKRMSIIIKDKNGIIKLYCKGADSEIMKRMSKTSKDNIYSNFTIKCVDKLSCKGYRSLLIAYKIIREEDYIKWNKELKNSEMNLAKKGKLVDKCYDKIEQELELIGATIVEDKLQDLVPETIKDLRMAGIKIWVLTGDKVDTAENIALSCNLISKNQKIFRIFIGQSETERSNNKKTPEVEKFFKEFNDFKKKKRIRNSIISNIKYSQESSHINSNPNSINNKSVCNLKILNQENKNIIGNNNNNSKCLNPNSIISNNNLLNKSNSISQSIDQLFPQIKSTANIIPSSLKILEPPPFSIIIESPLLTLIFSNKKETNSFLKIASKASSVICCRVSPLQKSLVVQEVKKYDKKAITLAIGDGGNDVSMIMEAHLGIGIYGEEGMRAVQASDFAIGEFKFLRRLLFFHGRINNNRISKMILYFFYKNFVFSIVQFVYAFFCIGSGQTLIDDWFITCYNLIFTALPLGVQAVSDFDLLESDHDIVIQFMPLLYIENRDIHPIFSLQKFVFNLSKGFIYSFLIFCIVCFCDVGSEINEEGDYGTLWYMSLKTYTSIIISVNLTLLLNMRYITFLFTLTMGITSFLLYIIFIIIVQYITMFNSCASIFHSLRTVNFYLCVFLVCSMSFLSDYMRESININFSNKISTNLLKYILDVDSQDNFMEGFVRTRKKYSETLQINYLQKKAMSKLSVFSNNSKISKNENILDLDNSNDETFKKAKSSELKFNCPKEKMNDHKNFYETMFEGKYQINESSVLEDEKKGIFFKPNEKWINASKIKLDNDNKILEIPHFQINTHI